MHKHFRLIAVLCVWTLLSLDSQAKAAEPTLKITGKSGETLDVTKAELQTLPRTEVEVTDRDGSKATFSGVELHYLLYRVGVPQGRSLRGEWMRSFVKVSASDGYHAVFALAELEKSFADRVYLLSDTRNGEDLDEQHGPFQIVVPGELRHSRWVKMITSLEVVDSHPPLDEAE